MKKLILKKGDTVKVISGESRGQEGKIISIDTKKNRVIVEGVNLISKSEKPSAKNTNGGITKKEGSIHISNLMFVEGGKTVRLGRRTDEKTGKTERYSKKTKEAVK
ncbi:MAG: 50S ribosomal protein L24 [Bacteroidia bacterium]|jgi:large subunit ribosomal protein L24|nr:50S ribosomal protein L24 [Sphingobacteriaceae bacterium]MBK7311509.1 50S ribosomal protein L24 [Sphingobacteriaceae bacterium]MBP9069397.1 50S ribosomal protein L24 [Bacteroidia bacterium]MDZ4665512.1 50S ribosomal protein L24 [Bacteroidota bacterium]